MVQKYITRIQTVKLAIKASELKLSVCIFLFPPLLASCHPESTWRICMSEETVSAWLPARMMIPFEAFIFLQANPEINDLLNTAACF